MVMECPNCKSKNIAKKGFRKNISIKKQKYQCKECNAWFINRDGFERMRHKPKIIARAIQQHIDGMSLSKVKNHLWQHDNVKMSRQGINNWIQKYSVFLKSDTSTSKTDNKRKNTLR